MMLLRIKLRRIFPVDIKFESGYTSFPVQQAAFHRAPAGKNSRFSEIGGVAKW